MPSGGLGCCCCTCAALQAYLECDAISIPGFTRLTDWQNLSSTYDGNCCYRAFYVADECEEELVCQEADKCPCDIEAPDGGTRIGTSTLSFTGCIREIIIYRHFYGPDEQIVPGQCPQFEWCKWVVLAAWRDYREATYWLQTISCFDADPPEWLETCPFYCADYCVFYNPPGWPTGSVAYCQACDLAINWWRIKVFDDLPQGTISFSNSDVLTNCINRLKCVNGPFFNLPFYTTPQCRSSWTGPCVCENPFEPTCLGELGVNHTFPDPFCANPPPTWSIEFGEPC